MTRGLSTAIAAVLIASMAVPADAVDPSPTSILIVGDSVTHGDAGDYTWRYFALRGLDQTGADVNFVGPNMGTFGGHGADVFSGAYADPSFDQDHAARWGLSMFEMLNQPSDSAPTITDLMNAQQPDVVVEMLGINDFMFFAGLDAEMMNGQVRKFVADARAVKPDVDVVLGSLPQTWVANVPAYNEGLPALAADLSTADSRVAASPVPDFTRSMDVYDDVHPTTAGQVKIAASVSMALEDLGIGKSVMMPLPANLGPHDPKSAPTPTVVEPSPQPEPEPGPVDASTSTPAPTITAPTQALPTAPAQVRAKRAGRRTVVRWSPAFAATSYFVRCGTQSTSTASTSATLRATAGRCKVRSINAAGSSAWAVVRLRA